MSVCFRLLAGLFPHLLESRLGGIHHFKQLSKTTLQTSNGRYLRVSLTAYSTSAADISLRCLVS